MQIGYEDQILPWGKKNFNVKNRTLLSKKKIKCNFDHGRGVFRFQKPLFWYHWTYSCPLVPNLEGGHLF